MDELTQCDSFTCGNGDRFLDEHIWQLDGDLHLKEHIAQACPCRHLVVGEELSQPYLPGRRLDEMFSPAEDDKPSSLLPVGKHLSFPFYTPVDCEVVGVVADVRQHGPEKDPRSEVYLNFSPLPMEVERYLKYVKYLVVKTNADPLTLAGAIPAFAVER